VPDLCTLFTAIVFILHANISVSSRVDILCIISSMLQFSDYNRHFNLWFIYMKVVRVCVSRGAAWIGLCSLELV
jgi:hypothetical protein